MLRGFLFSGKKSQVLLLAHHLAGDGKALVYFIEQLMRALNGEALPYQCLRTIYPEEIPAKNQILLSIGLYLRYWNHRWKKCEKIFNMEDRCRIHQLYWNTYTFLWNTDFTVQVWCLKKAWPSKSVSTLFVTTAGTMIGALIVTAAAWGEQHWLLAHLGVVLSAALPPPGEWWLLAAVIATGLLASLVPAWRAWRMSLADGLTPKQ